ncbi:MAG: DNA translocase FtsK [Clostridia bacterium]|nr:DNA translocase FtsK [Clostridia bacterium]
MATKKKSSSKKRPTKTVNKRQYRQPSSKNKRNQENFGTTALILAVVTVLLIIFIYFKASGIITSAIRQLLFGLFSSVAYLLPIILGVLTGYTVKKRSTRRFYVKGGFCLAAAILLACFIELLTPGNMHKISELWSLGQSAKGGGIFGGIVAIFLRSMIGRAASIVIVLVGLFTLISVIFKVNFITMIRELFDGVSKEFDDIDAEEKPKKKKSKKKIKTIKTEEDSAENIVFTAEELLEDDYIEKVNEEKKEDKQEDFDKNKFLEEVMSQLPETEGVREMMDEIKKEDESEKKIVKREKPITEEERDKVVSEIENSIEEKHEYVYPPIDLLKKPGQTSGDKRKEMLETSKKLMETLKNFGVEAKLLQVTNGPAVTRYEIQLNAGVKISKITGLSEDIALNLAVPTVLVAPVPGKAAVGIEVPNTSVGLVSARELIESEEFKKSESKLTVALGKDIGGRVIIGDIAKFPHILIAGATGSGKSVCINTIITSILYKASPDEVKLIMIDPKVVELGVYNGIPHLLIPVVTDPKRAAGALNWAVGEMMKRYALFAETGTRNLSGYNEHAEKNGEDKMPQIVIIIDELADLMMVAAKEVEDYICRLAQLARAAGIHLIVATQRPSVDVITGLIKANVPSRIAFAVSSGVDSRTILDRVGAEKLLGKGDMLYHPTGKASATRVQGAFVNDSEVEALVDFVKGNAEQTHYSHDLEEHIERISTGEHGVTDEDEADDADALLPDAIELALELGQISTAMVQRKLKVGYARAGRIIDQMETRGLISGANGSKPREVYSERIRATMDISIPEDFRNEY